MKNIIIIYIFGLAFLKGQFSYPAEDFLGGGIGYSPMYIKLDSIPGAVVGSIIIGLTQGYVAYYQYDFELLTGITLGNGFSLVAPYIIMFFILVLKPDGLFGTKEVERV